MSDLIRREDAIGEIREVYEYEFPTASGAFDEFVTVIIPNILRNLPSAEPERTAKVEWYPHLTKLADGHCECGEDVQREWKYCPNCGCRLEWK